MLCAAFDTTQDRTVNICGKFVRFFIPPDIASSAVGGELANPICVLSKSAGLSSCKEIQSRQYTLCWRAESYRVE